MKTEFTEFQREAIQVVNILRLHQEELEGLLKEIFPNIVIRITARGVPIWNPGTKEETIIYTTDEGEEYLITASGANHLAADWYNDKLFITFINFKKNNI
jgi:hypothetical protein